MNRRRLRISAVIACYRDAPAVPFMYERLRAVFTKLDVDYEIIFVNDASPDDAREVLAELAGRDSKVVVINHTRNFGSQSAFTSGMRISTGDAVALLDGDLQDPPELIESFYQQWKQGFDVVYGIRVKREIIIGAASLRTKGGGESFVSARRFLDPRSGYISAPNARLSHFAWSLPHLRARIGGAASRV